MIRFGDDIMNYKVRNLIVITFIVIISFFLKIDKIGALTCEYEMYPVNYKNVKDELLAVDGNLKSTAKLTYITNGDGNDEYSLEHVATFGGYNPHTFNENSFNKEVWKNKDKNSVSCPYYISVKKNSAEVIKESKFIEEQNSFMNRTNRDKVYPMVLVRQDSKVVSDPLKVSLEESFKNWSQITSKMDSYMTSSNCSTSTLNAENYNMTLSNFTNYVNKNYSSRNTKDQNMTESCWNARQSNVNTANLLIMFYNNVNSSSAAKMNIKNISQTNYNKTKELISKVSGTYSSEQRQDEVNDEITKITSDFCYLYCDTMVCKSTNATAQSECNKTCNSNTKPKCDTAYNSCKNIQSTSDFDSCMTTSFANQGLNYSEYAKIRAERLNELNQESVRLKTAIAQALHIEFNPYKIQCDDVSMFHILWIILAITGPFLTILMGVLDFGKAVISSNEEQIKKAWKKFPKRLLALIILILAPIVISIVVGFSQDESSKDTSLMYCIINGGK